MTNILMSKDGDILYIKINLTEEHGPSGSGKTTIVATTSGNQTVEHKGEQFKLGINLYKPRRQ